MLPAESPGGHLEKPHTFLVLDALRGVGALIVMETHFARFFHTGTLPHAEAAVDFFSMLSGFVLTYAYQDRLDRGWSTAAFYKVRMIRVYPIYLIGLLLGFVFSALQSHYGKVHASSGVFALLLGLGLLLLPAPVDVVADSPKIFPFDVPAWSLFFELMVNLLHALILRRRGWLFVAALTCLFGVSFQVALVHRGTLNIGAFRSDLLAGFSRIAFSYLIGVLLMLLWRRRVITRQFPAILPVLLFIGILLVPATRTIAAYFDVLLIVTILPAVILLSANATVPGPFRKIAQVVGSCSYSIYILHGPIAELFEQFWKRLLGHTMEADAPWSGLACFVTVFSLSLAVDRFIDTPSRAFLRRVTSSPQPRVMPLQHT